MVILIIFLVVSSLISSIESTEQLSENCELDDPTSDDTLSQHDDDFDPYKPNMKAIYDTIGFFAGLFGNSHLESDECLEECLWNLSYRTRRCYLRRRCIKGETNIYLDCIDDC